MVPQIRNSRHGSTGSSSDSPNKANALRPQENRSPAEVDMDDHLKTLAEFYETNPHFVTSPYTSEFGLTVLVPALFPWLLGPLNGKRVLDLGCGSGLIAEPMLALGISDYVGVDLVGDGFQSGPHRSFIKGDVHAIGDVLDSGDRFDVVLLLDVMEHLYKPDRVVAALKTRLVPAGVLFTSVPNYFNTAGLLKVACECLRLYRRHTWSPFGQWQAQVYETFMTSMRQRRILQSAGLRISHHLGMDWVSGLLPIFYGKEDVWLRGMARYLYEACNRLMFRRGQWLGKWLSMYSIVVAERPASNGE